MDAKPLTRLEDRWTFEECANASRKYQSRTEFLQGNRSAYRLALRNNWLRFFVWLKKPIKRKWNYDSCLSIAQKATSLSEFQRQYAGAYNAARKYGWLKDYTWFKPLHKSNGYWNYEECFKEAKKYKSKIEFRKNCSTAYSRALKHNWIKDYTWFLDTKYLQKKPRRWTEEACKQEAEKYTTKKDFLKNNASAYSVAIQNGWLKNYTWLKAGKKPNGYWNLDRCKEEAAKYANRSKFCKGCPAAFDSAARHQWLDKFFPK